MEPGSLCAQRLFIIQEEGGEREEKPRTPHGAQEKVNWKAPLLSLATDPEDSRCRDLRGWLGGLQEAWQLCCWLGTESPQGQVPGSEWLLCTQNISLQKALVEVNRRKAAPSQARPVVSGLSSVPQDQANLSQAGL